MRRLYSSFARGWPGAGLFLLRLVTGAAMIHLGLEKLSNEPRTGLIVLSLIGMGAGVLLLAGLWTPVTGTLAAILAIWTLIAQRGDPWIPILVGALGAALALLGPGAWSVDARLFGWKRLESRIRKV